jgi:hypothetical protein
MDVKGVGKEHCRGSREGAFVDYFSRNEEPRELVL